MSVTTVQRYDELLQIQKLGVEPPMVSLVTIVLSYGSAPLQILRRDNMMSGVITRSPSIPGLSLSNPSPANGSQNLLPVHL
jgi:hypothetical protein